MSALAVAATATTRLRVGSFVFVNDYRHPALPAREIAHYLTRNRTLGSDFPWFYLRERSRPPFPAAFLSIFDERMDGSLLLDGDNCS